MKIAAAAVAVVCVLSLPATPAGAGVAGSDVVNCSKATADHTGSYIHGCVGTMRGFRNSADPEAYAQLDYRANGMTYFSAKLNGVYFGCYFEDNYDTQYFAAIAAGYQNARFVIGARDGKCDVDGAQLNIGSRFTR